MLLTADASLELRAPIDGPAQGIAIEAHLDRGRGPVATVLVKRGTLRVGDSIVAGDAHGRVRAMLDENGNSVAEAGPARPVHGARSDGGAGRGRHVPGGGRRPHRSADRRAASGTRPRRADRQPRWPGHARDPARPHQGRRPTTLNLILKGDVSGSVEALEDALVKLEVADEVQLKIIHRGVGGVTQDDVNLASASDAIIIGFNVRAEGKVREYADRQGVEIRYYTVIYQAIEEVEAALKGMLKPEYEEVELGTAEIREVFRSSKVGTISGCIVRSGLIRRNAKARLLRDGAVVAENLTIASLKRFKDDATEVREGFECGLTLGNYNDVTGRRRHRDLRDAGEAARLTYVGNVTAPDASRRGPFCVARSGGAPAADRMTRADCPGRFRCHRHLRVASSRHSRTTVAEPAARTA